ncbi:MAG: 4-vinyl reductase [Actinobacteria bacterium]|nr:4-vinyl reductase [Actinomycetota bacterium]
MTQQLPVPVHVDPQTGEWSVDGIPMILVPRHFFVNNQRAVEEFIGHQTTSDLFREPGDRSAREWCAREAMTHDLQGVLIFHHYMKRLSQRGWAQFSVEHLDAAAGYARVRADHSVFVAEHGTRVRRKVCYMFQGWLEGALGYIMTVEGNPQQLKCREVQCAAEGSDHCLFEVRPEIVMFERAEQPRC